MCFPEKNVTTLVEIILSTMKARNQAFVSSGCMQVLYNLFEKRPSQKVLSAELNHKIMVALYDFKPSVNDVNPVKQWIFVLQKGLHAFVSRRRPNCLRLLVLVTPHLVFSPLLLEPY